MFVLLLHQLLRYLPWEILSAAGLEVSTASAAFSVLPRCPDCLTSLQNPQAPGQLLQLCPRRQMPPSGTSRLGLLLVSIYNGRFKTVFRNTVLVLTLAERTELPRCRIC